MWTLTRGHSYTGLPEKFYIHKLETDTGSVFKKITQNNGRWGLMTRVKREGHLGDDDVYLKINHILHLSCVSFH